MFHSTPSKPTVLKVAVTASFIAALAVSPLARAQEREHPPSLASGAASGAGATTKEVTGEIVDLMCYIDHGAIGEKHGQSCGAKCMKAGGPVGLIENGKVYVVVGEHKPINDELADSCGKTVTIKGKLAERSGIAMLANAEIVKK